MRDLRAAAEIEAQEVKLLLCRYRMREAIERVMDFPQSFFKPGSREYNSFRDYATALSDRYSWNVDLRWSRFLRQAVKVDLLTKRMIHHEDTQTVYS